MSVVRLFRPGVVTGRGYLVLALVPVAALVAWSTGWVEWWLVAAGIAAACLMAGLLSVGRNRYRVRVAFPGRRFVVGEPAAYFLEVTSASTRRQLPIAVEMPAGDEVLTATVPALAAGAAVQARFPIPTEQRAVYSIGPARTVRGDPWGLIRRVLTWGESELIVVHPKTVRLEGAVPGFFRDLEGKDSLVLAASDLSFHALRGYVRGDDRRHVHWKSTARAGSLLVRQYIETRRSHVCVCVSGSLNDFADENEYELALGAVASLGVQAFRDERALTGIAGSELIAAPSPGRLLDRVSALPRFGALESGSDLVSAARLGADRCPQMSVLVLVTGSLTATSGIQAAVRSAPPGVRVFVVQAAPGKPGGLRSISGAAVTPVGSLAELGRALRRVAA